MTAPLIYIVAGEHSGDVLGARLIHALRALNPSIRFAGIGGPRMEECGFQSLFPMHELAVMGLVEILPRVLKLRRRLQQTVQDIETRRPDLVLTIDSPGFCLRLLRAIQPFGIKRVHYVAPQVWAWREHRVKRFPGLWERLLCLLPFEEKWFAERNVPGQFVGHPVLESGADQGDAARFRARHGLAEDARVIVLMPGSRANEAGRLLPVYGETLRLLMRDIPTITPVIPLATSTAHTVRGAVSSWPVRPIFITDIADKHDAFAAAEAALTKSGTSTLELAMGGVPMAVTYRVNRITAMMARRLIRVPYVAMVNLLAGREIVPELLQENCTPTKIAAVLTSLMNNHPDTSGVGTADRQKQALKAVVASLHAPNQHAPDGLPSAAAAASIMDVLGQSSSG
ncbi:lipid-A-disaccharide synthase [Granulibacter bethesdensis]|uniref:lipid-A-disaccharide synthase n=1 Tax=Granulibacter bethesdensis TaxID=364410 RepID=UPI0009C05EE9|nr:lipid-A-disaccharide synthase [Granulibacter bethesdensis]